jgi:hypothetical protein
LIEVRLLLLAARGIFGPPSSEGTGFKNIDLSSAYYSFWASGRHKIAAGGRIAMPPQASPAET